MPELEQTGTLGEAAPRVLAAVPFMGADIRQKMLHRRLVAQKKLAVEMPRVPIDQHAAEIEDHDASPRLRHLPALDIPTHRHDNRSRVDGPTAPVDLAPSSTMEWCDAGVDLAAGEQ